MSERFQRAMQRIRDFWSEHSGKNPNAPRVFLTPEFSRLLRALEGEDSMAIENFCKVLVADPDKPKDGRNVNGIALACTFAFLLLLEEEFLPRPFERSGESIARLLI